MSEPRLRVLSLGVAIEPAAETAIDAVSSWAEAVAQLECDAILVDGDAHALTPNEVAVLAARAPVIVVLADAGSTATNEWLRLGADDVIGRQELSGGVVQRCVRQAVARRAGSSLRSAAYSTDADTGLPHRQQLVEHLSQLLALREREPSPMAVVALRVSAKAGSGDAAATTAERALLRRKVGVRLRAGLRASDVVAAIDDGAFAVLLGSLLAPGDADRVAAKLAAALAAPFALAGGERSLAVSFGVARFPEDGRDAEPLLGRALELAASAPAVVGVGSTSGRAIPGAVGSAANDDA